MMKRSRFSRLAASPLGHGSSPSAAATSAPNRVVAVAAAVEADGRVTALRFDQLDDYGAYLRSPMPGPLYRMHGSMTGAYDTENLAITNRLVMTNKTPSGLMRGFGGPPRHLRRGAVCRAGWGW